MAFYHSLITQKSFEVLQDFRRQFEFILIGGWAVFLYTHALKSKDIDIICDFEELEKIKTKYEIAKNERLRKYELKIEEIDIDIYLPFYWDLGFSLKKIKDYTISREGFKILRPEILFILKQKSWMDRRGTVKGEKDKIDLISLLKEEELDLAFYQKILKKYNLKEYLQEFKKLLESVRQVPELNLNQFQYSKLKKKVLKQL